MAAFEPAGSSTVRTHELHDLLTPFTLSQRPPNDNCQYIESCISVLAKTQQSASGFAQVAGVCSFRIWQVPGLGSCDSQFALDVLCHRMPVYRTDVDTNFCKQPWHVCWPDLMLQLSLHRLQYAAEQCWCNGLGKRPAGVPLTPGTHWCCGFML